MLKGLKPTHPMTFIVCLAVATVWLVIFWMHGFFEVLMIGMAYGLMVDHVATRHTRS